MCICSWHVLQQFYCFSWRWEGAGRRFSHFCPWDACELWFIHVLQLFVVSIWLGKSSLFGPGISRRKELVLWRARKWTDWFSMFVVLSIDKSTSLSVTFLQVCLRHLPGHEYTSVTFDEFFNVFVCVCVLYAEDFSLPGCLYLWGGLGLTPSLLQLFVCIPLIPSMPYHRNPKSKLMILMLIELIEELHRIEQWNCSRSGPSAPFGHFCFCLALSVEAELSFIFFISRNSAEPCFATDAHDRFAPPVIPSALRILRVLPAMILAISCLMLVQDTFTGNLLEARHRLQLFRKFQRRMYTYVTCWSPLTS